MKKKSISSRVIHNWVSVALVLPLFIIGMSTFFMSHEKALGGFTIGYTTEPVELKDLLHTPDGRIYLASKNGVFQNINNRLVPVEALQNIEIRVLELLEDDQVMAAGKQGLWINEKGDNWKKLHDADIHGIQILASRWYLITKEQNVVISDDQGRSWQTETKITQLLNTMIDKRPLQLSKLMHDLHTGKALMGHHYQWIWADILALVLIFLALTGIYMWWKSQKRKHAL